ncbi:MAG: HAD family hydrolase [Sterolibacteriaceae bacterium]|nr:HAD family hydrolase [Candidatus Methylophosphatis haderslevensis]
MTNLLGSPPLQRAAAPSPDLAATAAPGEAKPFDLLTVDVWDTLLRRRCHPDSVKLHVCRVLLLAHADAIPASMRDSQALLRLRQQAEGELGEQSRQRGLDDEYRHREVYARWLALAQFADLDDDAKTAELLRFLEDAELEQERLVCYADPTIAATLADYPARRTLFLSDFYFPAAAIGDLLALNGLDRLVQDGVVSCDVGLNKRSGRLYSHVHEDMSVVPARHVHIGDSVHADVTAARSLGITGIHYQPGAEHARRQHLAAGFADRSAFLREAADRLRSKPEPAAGDDAAIHAYGCHCSPLLVGFVLDVMERATAARADRLHFFTREGEFFLEIYRRLAARNVLGVPVPEAGLLQVSRLATFAASLGAFSPDKLMRIWSQYSVQSIGALLASLGMAPRELAEAAARFGLQLDDPIRYPWQDARVLAFIGDCAVRKAAESHIERRREELLAYLADAGVWPHSAHMHIVDIGWRGTIQDNLAHLLPQTQVHGYYLGLSRYLNRQPANTVKSAYGPNLNETDGDSGLLDFVAPIEMLCNSAGGSVREYRLGADRVEVVRQVDPDENAVFNACARHFQAGVLDSIPLWADFLRTHAYTATDLRPLALERWREIIDRPPAFLARAYFRLKHNETFGVGAFEDKRAMLSTRDLLLGFVSSRRRDVVNRFLARMGWIPGMLARPDIGGAFRGVLRVYLWGRSAKQRMARRADGRPPGAVG